MKQANVTAHQVECVAECCINLCASALRDIVNNVDKTQFTPEQWQLMTATIEGCANALEVKRAEVIERLILDGMH